MSTLIHTDTYFYAVIICLRAFKPEEAGTDLFALPYIGSSMMLSLPNFECASKLRLSKAS